MKLPCNDDVNSQRAILFVPGAMLPKSTLRAGVTGWFSSWVPMIMKSMSRPLTLSTICGLPPVMVSDWAAPWPMLLTCTASE